MITKEISHQANLKGYTKVGKSKFGVDLPVEFVQILTSLDGADKTVPLKLAEGKPLVNLSKYSIVIEMVLEPDLATGRFVVMYDPSKEKNWGSPVRVAAFFEANISEDEFYDRNYAARLWGAFELEMSKIRARNLAGTASKASDEYFGRFSRSNLETAMPESYGIELRASWGADNFNLRQDLLQFSKIMYYACHKDFIVKPSLKID
ncbi:MAG: DUF3000 domain-containing protein [Candidatus Ancillula sp.]|jgi:hypothetical protein|nr:DUF3000 domain-containing protein [Candidatus Ancillula sp.]